MVMIPFDDRIKIERYLREKGVPNKLYDSDWDGILNLESIPTIPRTKLEYPTENVTFVYLSSIDKMKTFGGTGTRPSAYGTFTLDDFTDKAVYGVMRAYVEQGHWGRWIDPSNWYEDTIYVGGVTNDHRISTVINGTRTIVASESVDLSGYTHPLRLDIIGSTIKSTRDDAPTPQLVVTDTTHPVGKFGSFSPTSDYNDCFDYLGGRLIPPASQGLKALAVVETNLKPSEEEENTLVPDIPRKLVKVKKGMKVPIDLFIELKKYDLLKKRGFSDEEIEIILGKLPQCHIDTLSITYGSFEPSSGDTIVLVVYGDNMYKKGAIKELLTFIRSKGHRKFRIPRSKHEAKELIKELKKTHPEIKAGSDNLLYQVTGGAEFEALATADYYDGFAEGIYDDKKLDNLPDKVIVNSKEFKNVGRTMSELSMQIARTVKRIKKARISPAQKELHLRKIVKLLKR